MKKQIISTEEIRNEYFPATAWERMLMIKNGVSKHYLLEFKKESGLTFKKFAILLGVTSATLMNKKKTQKFDSRLSESIIGLADLYNFGFEVFEDKDKFIHWINTSNRALGREAPFNIIDTHYGREVIKNLLGKIEYGFY